MGKANKLHYPEFDFRRVVITTRRLLQFQTRQYNGDLGVLHLWDSDWGPRQFPDGLMYKVKSISFIGDPTSVDFIGSTLIGNADIKATYSVLKSICLDHDLTLVFRLANTPDVWVVNNKSEGFETRYVNFDGVVPSRETSAAWASEMYNELDAREKAEQGDENRVVMFDMVNRAEF